MTRRRKSAAGVALLLMLSLVAGPLVVVDQSDRGVEPGDTVEPPYR